MTKKERDGVGKKERGVKNDEGMRRDRNYFRSESAPFWQHGKMEREREGDETPFEELKDQQTCSDPYMKPHYITTGVLSHQSHGSLYWTKGIHP